MLYNICSLSPATLSIKHCHVIYSSWFYHRRPSPSVFKYTCSQSSEKLPGCVVDRARDIIAAQPLTHSLNKTKVPKEANWVQKLWHTKQSGKCKPIVPKQGQLGFPHHPINTSNETAWSSKVALVIASAICFSSDFKTDSMFSTNLCTSRLMLQEDGYRVHATGHLVSGQDL